MQTLFKHHGSLGVAQYARWKSVSKTTMAELAVSGKLTPAQIQKAINTGRLSKAAFRKAFWESMSSSRLDSKDTQIIQKYKHILF